MSLSQPMILGITETSSVSEILSVMKKSYFNDKTCDDVGRILINKETNVLEKYELLDHDYKRAMHRKVSNLKELKKYKEQVGRLMKAKEERRIEDELAQKVKQANEEKMKKLMEEKEHLLNDLKSKVNKLKEAIAKELAFYNDQDGSRDDFEKVKKAATTQEFYPLEVGAGLDNRNRTTIRAATTQELYPLEVGAGLNNQSNSTTQELYPLEVGAGLDNQNRTTIRAATTQDLYPLEVGAGLDNQSTATTQVFYPVGAGLDNQNRATIRAATIHELYQLEVGIGLDNHNRTTMRDTGKTDVPRSQVPFVNAEDEVDSDDESVIIANSQKRKRA